MKSIMQLAASILIPVSIFGFTSCSTVPGTENVSAIETPDGAIIVETFTTTATVAAVDATTRKVTLEFPNKKKTTYKCGPEVVNFPQIQVGDTVKAVVSEEAAIYIGQGASPSAAVGVGVKLAPVGYRPGGELVETAQATARVTAINAKAHKVTLQFADNSTSTVKVGKQVNLSAVPIGTDVTVQVSEGVAISVTKP